MLDKGAKKFFEGVVWEEMDKRQFRNEVVCAYLANLLQVFVAKGGEGIFHVRKDPALSLVLPGMDRRNLLDIGNRLLFGIGIFPEHFVARGKRRVSLRFYRDMLYMVVARRLALRNQAWQEIYGNFAPSIAAMNGVRSRFAFKAPDLMTLVEIIMVNGMTNIYPEEYLL